MFEDKITHFQITHGSQKKSLEKCQTNNLIFHFKKLEKKKSTQKPKASRRKEIILMRK